ncbi:transposase [Candidatus Woesearchaeota archaeon]|nr:transposase [Candidatus Woesearchaeota archaeon]
MTSSNIINYVVSKTIKFKVRELRKGKKELIDLALNNSINAIKDFMELSLKNKTTSNKKLHRLGYKEIVRRYNLSACIVHQSRNKASEIIKSWKSNKRRLNKNIPLPEPRAQRIRYDNVVFDVIKTENKEFQFWASILVAKRKRIYIPLTVNSNWQKSYLNDLIQEKYKQGSADLVKKGNDYFVHIVIKKEVEFKPQENYNPIGIDVGINNLAVVNVNGRSKFFNGKRAIAKKKHLNKVKAIYQNRNNLKMLEAIKGREQRYFNHINHNISSWVINQAKLLNNPVIVMEDLTYILDTTRVRKKQRYIHQTWSFRRLQNMIQYKALWDSIPIVYINPEYTSQVCPKCLSTNKRNKHNYKCRYCDYEANADHVGAVNIRKKFLESISFEDMASINNAIGFSFKETQTMNIGKAKKYATKQEGVSPPITEVKGIRNTYIL